MNLLAIDTSTDRASITLSVGERIYLEEHHGAKSHAQTILTSIDYLLSKVDVTIAELDGIVFGRGPGSFTGLRVGCSIAKGLAYAHDLPIYPVSTLAAIISATSCSASLDCGVLAIIDARMGQVYWAYTPNTESALQKEAVSFVKDIDVPGTLSFHLAGVGWEGYEQEFSNSLKKRIAERARVYPETSAMIRLVERGFIEPVSAGDALPVYIRDQVTS